MVQVNIYVTPFSDVSHGVKQRCKLSPTLFSLYINDLANDIKQMRLCARLFICALWSPAGKGLTSWLSFVVSNCEFVTFPLVSWVGCGT